MIVKPTVNELLEHAENRFALVIATSRRARQIASGEEKLTDVTDESPVTVAANEIVEGKVKVIKKEDLIEENMEENIEENNEMKKDIKE